MEQEEEDLALQEEGEEHLQHEEEEEGDGMVEVEVPDEVE